MPDPASTAAAGMVTGRNLVCFRLSRHRYACDLDQVEAALRMVAITPVPDVPQEVIGVIDFHGDLLPVVDVRPALVGVETPRTLDDRLLVLRVHGRRVAVIVDEVTEVLETQDRDLFPPPAPLDQSPLLSSVLRMETGLVFVLRADMLVPADLGDALKDAHALLALIRDYLNHKQEAAKSVSST